MSEHIDRMKSEHKELTVKVSPPNAFIRVNSDIAKALSDLEKLKMIKQSGFMEAYADALKWRIWVR